MIRFVLVVGPPRSGTSVTAGVLDRLGVAMGGRDYKSIFNPTGYFEARDIVTINQRLVKIQDWSDIIWRAIHYKNTGERVYPLSPSDKDNFLMVVIRRSGDHEICGVKDPRFCFGGLFRAFYEIALMEYEMQEIALIATVRKTSEIVASMLRVGRNIPQENVIEAAQYYQDRTREIYANFEGPKMKVVYQQLVDVPIKTVGAIADFINRPITQGALELINPDLKHYTHN